MEAIDLSDWDSNTCPFCGFYPEMSKIIKNKDNFRMLHCGLCDYEWQFRRIRCAICGNDDKDSLGYYTAEDDDTHRVDFCNECKGYIKTIWVPDEFEESRYDLTVENVITNYLDATLIDMGYNRP